MAVRISKFVLGCFLALFVVSACARGPGPEATASLRDASHSPTSPRTGQPVQINATTAASVTNLVLEYQLIDPGAYIALRDPAYRGRWLTLSMNLKTKSAAENSFSVDLPGDLQVNRRLVRYRFSIPAVGGRALTFPAPNDPVPNFAYFVYDGIPAWNGAINPQGYDPAQRLSVAFDTNVMRRVQPYFLLGQEKAVRNVTWNEPTGGKEYRYTATLVADGVVYDHIRMRARGGVWRYAMGKNMWKFAFSKNQRFQPLDDYGQRYPINWNQINLRSCIQQGNYGYRGEQGMFESVGFRLFHLAGVPAPFTHWIQLRIITGRDENPANQYQGDFWGLYLAIEEVDGRFLRAHQLPDGNVFKMESGSGVLSHHGFGAQTNLSDLYQFLEGYSVRQQPESWWRSQLDLPEYYSYRAICECIHHYDIGDGKNYYYYANPGTRKWEVVPWDIDLTWANTMYGSGEEPFKRRVLNRPVFQIEYQNRLREIRDLLYNPDEAGRLIDECAAIIADPKAERSIVDADRAKWDFHPAMARAGNAGQGLFYRAAPTRNFSGMVQVMKNYIKSRAAWIDRNLLYDPQIPGTPTLSYVGPADFPRNQLNFHMSDYQGRSPWAATQWRLGEIAPPTCTSGRPTAPGIYEITPVWESGVLTQQSSDIQIPPASIVAAHRYRARVRVQDSAGRWSHWSAPVEFVAGEPKA